MATYIEGITLTSPFRVLREQSGLTIAEAACAISIWPELLEGLERVDWDQSILGASVVTDLLARLGAVFAARVEHKLSVDDDLCGSWGQPFCELGNSFNSQAWNTPIAH